MSNEPIYHVMDIIRGTTVDGPGFRTSPTDAPAATTRNRIHSTPDSL